MTADQFTERIAQIRQRFVSTLDGKIEAFYSALPSLSDDCAAVEEAYRRIHGIVGVGKTVGFPGTGTAARDVEDVLMPAYRAGRGLNSQEIDALKTVLKALHEAAQEELNITESS